MKLTIIAATGGIGRWILEQALGEGHTVTAVVRNPSALSKDVPRVVVDLARPDPAALASAIEGADAVLSGLGARSKAEAGVAWRGTRAIVDAMNATHVRRLVVVSAAPIGTVPSPAQPNPPKHDPGDGFFMRNLLGPFIKAVLREHYADLAHMEDVVRESDLDWTIVRPPRLTNGSRTSTYRTALGQNVRGGHSVSRASVGDCMLRVLEQPETVQQVVGVAD
jgi:putative NADH-flavin reductase